MPDLTPAALHILHRQLSTITASQLRASGVTEAARRRMLDERTLERLGHSVYRVAGAPQSYEARLVQLSLQHPSGFVTGPSGGGYRGLRRMPRLALVEYCVPHGARFTPPNWARLRQSNRIPDDHVLTLDNGIRIASWHRLAFDLARDLSRRDLTSVMDQMIRDDRCTIEDFVAVGRAMCGPGRPGSKQFEHALAMRHGGPPADSHPELLVLEGLLRREVPVEPQHRLLELPNGGSVRIDMAVPSIRWAVEVDVHDAHIGLIGTTADKQRDRQLHLIDWQVDRVTRLDLIDLRGTLDELAALYCQRRLLVQTRA